MLGMGRWPCCYLFCKKKRHIRPLCITMTRSRVKYHTYKTTNHWHSVDAHAKDGAVTVLLSPFTIKVVNTSVMHNNDQVTAELPYLQDHKLLMLCWRSRLEWGGDRVAISIANNSCQYVRYAYQRPCHWWITVLTRSQIVDAMLTLILMYCPFNICCHQ